MRPLIFSFFFSVIVTLGYPLNVEDLWAYMKIYCECLFCFLTDKEYVSGKINRHKFTCTSLCICDWGCAYKYMWKHTYRKGEHAYVDRYIHMNTVWVYICAHIKIEFVNTCMNMKVAYKYI